MADGQPKLLIVTGEESPAGGVSRSVMDAVAAKLGSAFDVVPCSARDIGERASDGPNRLVLMSGSGLLHLARETGQSRDRVLLNALGEGVCLTDLDGGVVWSNDRFRAYTPAIQKRIASCCRQAARQMVDPALALDETLTHSRRFEVEVPAGEGSSTVAATGEADLAEWERARYFEVLVSAVASQEETPTGRVWLRHMAAIVWDVTRSSRMAHKMHAIERAGNELVRIDVELVRSMHTPERLRVVEQKIVKILHDLLHFDTFNIRLVDRNGKLELVMSRGLTTEGMELELFARPEGNGISGWVAATGKSYVCRDTLTDPRYKTGVEGARSSLTVPLVLSQKVIGILNVESNKPAAFGEEDRQFAEMLATSIALALHILDLLRAESVEAKESVGANVEEELAAPLEELAGDVAKLKAAAAEVLAGGAGAGDPKALQRTINRIVAEVETLKRRVKDVTSGPQLLLGSDEALAEARIDPLIAGKRILVADDEEKIRTQIRDNLSARGADVVVCADASSAIAALQASALGPKPSESAGAERVGSGKPTVVGVEGGFHLLVSDIRLPDKTGYEIFAAAKQVNARMPVILMTGFGHDPHHSIVRASVEGLKRVMFKPFQADRLIEEVQKALQEWEEPGSAQGETKP